MKNLATSQTMSPELRHSHLRLIGPEVDSIATLLVAEYGSAASPLAKTAAVAAFEQGELHGFADWCLMTIALNKLNLGAESVGASKSAHMPGYGQVNSARNLAAKLNQVVSIG